MYHMLLTTAEMGSLLGHLGCRLFSPGRVEQGDKGTPIADFLSDYEAYLQALLRNPEPLGGWVEMPEARPMRTLLATLPYSFRIDRLKGGALLRRAREPVPLLAPQTIGWMRERIELRALFHTFAFIGLEVTFPLVAVDDGDRIVRRHEAHPHHQLFLELCGFADAITSPCTFNTPAGPRRTKLRASADAKALLAGHQYLQRHNLSVA